MNTHHAQPGAVAILAGYRAHKTDTHHGTVNADCPTCSQYLLGILTAPTPTHSATITTCRGQQPDPAQAATAANTAPNATATWQPYAATEPASAPNASASNAPE